MLKHLYITNYAIIESLELNFDSGFTVITGETGAGKSILLGALSLILGKRVDTSVLNNKDKKCVVEGIFSIDKKTQINFFNNNNLDFETATILRREISSSGKSRAFINDTPVNLSILKELTEQLIDIHSQYDTLQLKENTFQIKVIDAFAKQGKALEKYKVAFSKYKKSEKELLELIEQSKNDKTDFDYISFQAKEIEELDLKENEKEQIEEELQLINNSEEIKAALTHAVEGLVDSDLSLIQSLKEVNNRFNKIKDCSEKYKLINERLTAVIIELEDLSQDINNENDDFTYDPENLNYLNNRISRMYALEQKHGLNSTKEILDLFAELNKKLQYVGSYEDEIEKQQILVEKNKAIVIDLATRISNQRVTSIKKIEQNILKNLSFLGMPDASFKIELEIIKEPNENGINDISFLFSANKGFKPQTLNKVASGGELSRLMLIIKMILAEGNEMSSIVFDEIDTGVSGDIADKMSDIMKQMSENTQVLSITHLPQIASKGDHHFRIAKSNNKGKAITNVEKLTEEDRVSELAKMLSGKSLTEEAIQNAKALLRSN